MFPSDVAGIVRELQCLVRGGVKRPAPIPADRVAGEPGNADLGKAEVCGVGDARVDAHAIGIQIVVGNIDLLPKPVISNVELVGEPRIGRPQPCAAKHLSPRFCLRQEHRIEHGYILFRLQTVADEIIY